MSTDISSASTTQPSMTKFASERAIISYETGKNVNSNNNSKRIDRQKTCPFMIKLYCRMNGHHRLEEFAPPRFPVDDEVIIYTWRDATLRELSNLVRGVLPTSQANDPTLKFSFTLLYPNPQRSGAFVSRPLGWAFEKGGGGGVGEPRGLQLQDSSERTLESFRFLPGDIIDVAVYTNPAMIPRR